MQSPTSNTIFLMRNISDRLQKSEQRKSDIPTSSLSEALARILVQSATAAGCVERQVPLIRYAVEAVGRFRPDVFIWENVKGVFFAKHRSDFWSIIKAFADIGGYRLEWQLFNTAWFLPQNRERIYLVGRVANRCTGDVFPFPAPGGGNHPCRKDTVHSHTCGTITRNYYKQPNFGNYLINLQPGETFDGQPNEEQKSRIRMLTEVECERLQGFPDDFTRYGIINGEVREISRANRYAMLGNAVSVPVVRAP